MKSLLSSILSVSLVLAFAGAAVADIQAPPMSEQGPTRKLGRGISNVAFGVIEIPYTVGVVNATEGNSAAAGYGVILGVHRFLRRLGSGLYDIATHPAPTYRGTYRSTLPSDVIWGQNGYAEFPPELGFETRFDYSRTYPSY